MSRTARYMSRLLSSEIKQDIFTKVLFFTYSSVEGWPPCGRCAVRTPSGAGPPGVGFFPRLETFVSKSSEAILFLPWGEGILDSSPRLSSFAETLIPRFGCLMCEARFRLLYSSLHLLLMSLDKVHAQASWSVQDTASLREEGPNT